jgi:hypothetical protein
VPVRSHARAPTESIAHIFVAADSLVRDGNKLLNRVAARQVLRAQQTNKQTLILCPFWSQNDPQRTCGGLPNLHTSKHRAAEVWIVRFVSASITRRRNEAAKLPLHELGKGNRCAVLEIRADDLDTDRQTGF